MNQDKYQQGKGDWKIFLERFKDVYFGETGLKADLSDQKIDHAREQFSNSCDYLETEIPKTSTAFLGHYHIMLRNYFESVAKTLEDGKVPSDRLIQDFESHLERCLSELGIERRIETK